MPEHNSGVPEHNSGVPENQDPRKICRIYEVSENVVEKYCRIKSKNIVGSSRNLSKFVEICLNVEKCCRNQSKNVVEMSKMCFLIFPTP